MHLLDFRVLASMMMMMYFIHSRRNTVTHSPSLSKSKWGQDVHPRIEPDRQLPSTTRQMDNAMVSLWFWVPFCYPIPILLRGLCSSSYFGPRTCGGGITNVSKSKCVETYDGPAWLLMATLFSAPFQGFARQSGIQVFRLYSSSSPGIGSQWRPMMVPRGDW
jgi:hypothetical protein